MTGVLLAATALVLLLARVSMADDPPCRPPLVERQRYGFVATSTNWPQRFDIAQLGAGWTVDFQPTGTAPSGMDRALTIRIGAGYAVDPGMLGPLVDNNPGALWLVGNEPDCIWQDNVTPEEYARIYHDLYYFIKTRDGTSQIAAGSIVQPTPLRLQYLDRVLAAYQARYHRAMPLDVWNIHNAILNEVSCDYDPDSCWGAGIPPGIDADSGVIRGIQDNDNMSIFQDQIWAFRQWMANRGYRGYPLIVTEYGVLMPAEYGFGPSRVNAFMSSTFDFFSVVVDPTLGDPTDGNRLVQRWAWFSLDMPPWNPVTGEGFNGNLFDPVTAAITPFGQHYASHTSSFPPLETVDLGLAAWDMPAPPLVVSPTQTISYSLRVRIGNSGTVDSGSFTVTLAYEGPVSGMLAQMFLNLPPVSSQWVTFTLDALHVGGYLLSLEIDPDNQVREVSECNNQGTQTLVVPRYRQHLPLVLIRTAGMALPQAAPDGTRAVSGWIAGKLSGQRFHLPASARTPGFVEFDLPNPDSYPGQLALDAERHRLWVTERDGDRIVSFDLLTETWGEEYALAPASQPWGLAVDGAGNVWFAENGAGRIGMLDLVNATITEYPISVADSRLWDLAVDDDGTIWFTERGHNKIGKLLPATNPITVTEYSLPQPMEEPTGIAVAPDAVWFTLTASDHLGWFDKTQHMEALPRPENSRPLDIVLTSADKPWFTEEGKNRIVLCSPSTAFLWTVVDVLTPDSQPVGIAMEGDIAVWFTERAGNKLGRYRGGRVAWEYSLPTPNSQPTDIVVDDDGCAWYTAPGVSRIGRFCPTPHTFIYLPLALKD